jgi:hypothetical protein
VKQELYDHFLNLHKELQSPVFKELLFTELTTKFSKLHMSSGKVLVAKAWMMQ